jgi:hypothetical protein
VHPSDALIDRLLHRELPSAEIDAVGQHLMSCEPCARRRSQLAAEEFEIADALRMLDHPAARGDLAAVIARSNAVRGARLWRLAASIAVAAFAATAVAMPGSAVRSWLSRVRPRTAEAPAPVASSPAAQTSAPTLAGISVAAGDSVAILFEEAQEVGRMSIALRATSKVDIRAIGGAAAFSVQTRGVRIRNRGSAASYEIVIPTSARTAEVRVAGRLVFASRGGTVVVAPPRESDGSYVVTVRKGSHQ